MRFRNLKVLAVRRSVCVTVEVLNGKWECPWSGNGGNHFVYRSWDGLNLKVSQSVFVFSLFMGVDHTFQRHSNRLRCETV
jgi:hypothetical protein